MRQITSRERRSRELEEARRRAEEASAAKSQLLANVSHEIRTPLNDIVAMLSLLAETELTQEQRGFVELATTSSETLLKVIDDVLDHSRSEAGRLDLDPRPFDLEREVSRLARLFARRTARRAIDLRVRFDPAAPIHVFGDHLRLRQVLFNLVDNAVNFTQRGHVLLDVACVEGPMEVDGGARARYRFRVEDTGVGIQESRLERVFDQLAQADGSATRTHGGTGLGLAISRDLVGLMGGELLVTSRVGEGSTFWFELSFPVASAPAGTTPAAAVPAGPACATAPPAPPGDGAALPRPLRVLLAEDHPVSRKAARAMLRRYRAEVHEAEDGEAAVRMVRTGDYDLVLMDLGMPLLDGLQATMAIRALGGRLARLPIVALTARAMPGDRERCLAAGMDDYLAKPIQPDALTAVIGLAAARAAGGPEPAAAAGGEPGVPDTAASPAADAGEEGDDGPDFDRPDLERRFLGDAALIAELVEEYIEDTRDLLVGLHRAVAESDRATATALAHGLQGASAMAGAPVIARLAALLRAALREAPPAGANVSALLPRLGRAVERYAAAARRG